MTKVTIGKLPKSFKDYPKIMIEHDTGSIYWFQKENVGVLLVKGQNDESTNEISKCYHCSNMDGYAEFDLPIILQNA